MLALLLLFRRNRKRKTVTEWFAHASFRIDYSTSSDGDELLYNYYNFDLERSPAATITRRRQAYSCELQYAFT